MAVRKAVILAGGYGTRLMEETETRPKPMVEIGGRPILWHIMKIYSAHGINEFVIALGYKGYMIKEFFANYRLHMSDVTFDYGRNDISTHVGRAEAWKVTLVDTGAETMTGGRLKRLADYVGDEPFCMTYGDGVAQIDIGGLIAYHERHGRAATVTAVRPPSRFGALETEASGRVAKFREKPPGDGMRINGGFFILSPRVLDYIPGDETVFEKEPMERLAEDGELMAWEHDGFWHSMDTLRDKRALEAMWSAGQAPWMDQPLGARARMVVPA
ncbi:glucose-1-phosphate cytidylyltransferase [Falsiroseomonas ponticola]|uniref:glucose-1-phosphate cytidylyltransferase n=1 Tax=Falsiroseomonas ponticola TaxID=2786951 RepID=UPI001934B41F|nr:glucose-1-phosphate cytidylyltransferase [Roseomonas ponticola]